MCVINFLLDIAKSIIQNKAESSFVSKSNQSKEKKEVLRIFENAIIENIKQHTGKNEIGMIQSFLNKPDIYETLKKTMIISDKEEAIKRLSLSFQNHTRGSFGDDFNYDKCIRYAVEQLLLLHGNDEQRNMLALGELIKEQHTPILNSSQTDTTHILRTFSTEKDKIYPEECFYDYDCAITQMESLWENNHIVQIVGPKGSGKKQIIAHLAYNKDNVLFVKAAKAKTKDSFIRELSTRCLSYQTLSPDAISYFFAVNQGYTIILADTEEIDNDLKDYLSIIPCKIIITSTKKLIPDIPTYNHCLPTIEQGMQIYKNYKSLKEGLVESSQNTDTITKIIEEAGRIPECIRYLALYQLYVDEKIDVSELKSIIRNEKNPDLKILSPTEYMKTILLPEIDITLKMKDVLKVISTLPDKTISKRFLQYLIQCFEGDFNIYDLVSKGFGTLKTIDDTDMFVGSALINIQTDDDDEDFIVKVIILFVKYVHAFIIPDNYTLKEIFEACELCEFYFSSMYEIAPDPSWCIMLEEKAELYEYLGLHQKCINECYRILSIKDIDNNPLVVVRTKVTLSRALAEYGFFDQAEDVIQSISIEQTNDEDKSQIDQTIARIEFEKENYDQLILSIKTNISDNPYEKIAQFHQLATMYYHLQEPDDAKEYFELAKTLVDELHFDNTTIASMIYAAGSAIYLDLNNPDKAIDYGKKSLEISIAQSKNIDSHILTSYNNLGNAYLISTQYAQAAESYTYVLNNYDVILSPKSSMITNSRINLEICIIMESTQYDAKQFEHLMIDLAKDKKNYQIAILSIISAGVVLTENCDFAKLKPLLDISQKWICDYVEYPQMEQCRILYNRLALAESIGTSFCTHEKNPDDCIKLFKNHWEYIKRGMFDNADDNPKKRKVKQIPVYYIEQNNNIDSPGLYWVLASFPPKGVYMGYIMPDDSMKPTIKKGDILWVKKNKNPEIGDIVLYCTDDKKKWICRRVSNISSHTILIPDNKDYKAIPLGQQEPKVLCGIILE